MLGHALEVMTGMVWAVWIAAMHHTNSPTSVMSRYVLPATLAVAYGSIIIVSYAGAEDPHSWPLFVVRAIAAAFLYFMLWLIWMLRSGSAPITEASATLGPTALLRRPRRKQLLAPSSGSARLDQLLAAQQKEAVTV